MIETYPKLKRIAAINDVSGFGKCSLTVALPVVSASGVECACIPTALLSTHTGEFTGWTRHDLTGQMMPIARHWASLGLEFDGIYSGYLASPEQALVVEEIIGTLAGPDTLVICDPAMADNGEYYSGFDTGMAQAFRRLCARADIITPNVTEAALLSGVEYSPAPHSRDYIARLFNGLERHAGRYVAITGVHPAEGVIGTVVRDRVTGEEHSAMSKAYPGMFYGTGDIFASALSALLVRGAGVGDALEAASSLVRESIERTFVRNTPRPYGVDFEGALPAYVRRVEAIFAG
ncbi:MAG TPA: pyridoxamine kinase [Candidatus Scatomorpha merdigallinarum]|nr:pyridoxamine kinase [Candidatus Scatomorpha merdigallinarum]